MCVAVAPCVLTGEQAPNITRVTPPPTLPIMLCVCFSGNERHGRDASCHRTGKRVCVQHLYAYVSRIPCRVFFFFRERTPRPGDSFLLLLFTVMTTLFNSNPDKIFLSLSSLNYFPSLHFSTLVSFSFFSTILCLLFFSLSLSLHFSLSSSSLMCCQAHSQWPRANVWVRQRRQRRGRERTLEFANI